MTKIEDIKRFTDQTWRNRSHIRGVIVELSILIHSGLELFDEAALDHLGHNNDDDVHLCH